MLKLGSQMLYDIGVDALRDNAHDTGTASEMQAATDGSGGAPCHHRDASAHRMLTPRPTRLPRTLFLFKWGK
ncbi:hypothetical protein KDH_64640 [Dictyobacter sp. S3.2.2.5]|uniref:Uncharacterized protein n=1 Tax=Dictyobacter halimunensis TaxID=3026934 RepID=A0ABQ6G2A6_9CHLR|nr:hypothetical protein KDH_64640 [Dictyobacter sp. S3.2.2.5]